MHDRKKNFPAPYLRRSADKRSPLSFSISKALKFDENTGKYIPGTEARHSLVYVFCVYTACKNDSPASPLNLDLWDFYVVSPPEIDAGLGNQESRLTAVKKKFRYAQCSNKGLTESVCKAYEGK